ncbi:MAG TPA: hypothetical protein HPQ04_06485 [Rhodospirillaceae bacterium]|nr:hypothetical protein [Rhodospirillaceae bacterium]
MTVSLRHSSVVAKPGQTIKLSSLINVTADGANPGYLIVNGLDRNEYPAADSGVTGSLVGGNKTKTGFSTYSGDARTTGVVFAYDPTSGRYYSSTYGYLDQMTYHASAGADDFTELSVYGASDAGTAATYAANTGVLMYYTGTFTPIGSVGIVNQPNAVTPPSRATPNELAATAMGFVGRNWSRNGCWTLAQTIASEAGATLPVASTYVGAPGEAGGEWMVTYNGAAGQSGDWQSMVRAGDVVVFGNKASTVAHITTCVAGSGASAQLVDNAALSSTSGQPLNPSTDGSANDITVAGPIAASLEWAAADPSQVVIYRLDTPVVADRAASTKFALKSRIKLTGLFSVNDPAKQRIVKVQAYDSSDVFLVNGRRHVARDAAHAVSATSLSAFVLKTGKTAGTDTIMVRAENALGYWGDWQSFTGTVGKPLPVSGATVASSSKDANSLSLEHQSDLLVQGLAQLPSPIDGLGAPMVIHTAQTQAAALAAALHG